MGVCCSCCRSKTIEEDDEDDDLAATTANAAKDAKDAKETKVDIAESVSSLDAGTVEICVARLRTSDARAKAFEERDLPLHLILYYRRQSPHAVEGGKGEHGTWVLIDKKECLPNRFEKGAMVVNFRERALRELSRHKAPLFKLPSSFDLNCPMQLVCRDPGGHYDSGDDSDDEMASSSRGTTPSKAGAAAMTSPGGSTPFKDGADRPVAHRTNGGRVAPRTVGELPRRRQRHLRKRRLLARLRAPDPHGRVPRRAGNVLAVRRVRRRVHIARVPRQRALLLNPSLVSHLLGIHRSNKADHPMGSRTSSPVVAFQILTELSVEDPSQCDGRPDALAMCLPSGENETDQTGSECPVSVHSCSWPNLARQHQCKQQQLIQTR